MGSPLAARPLLESRTQLDDRQSRLDGLLRVQLRLALEIGLAAGCATLLVVASGVNSGLRGPQYTSEWLELLVGLIPQACDFVCLCHLSQPMLKASERFFQGHLWQPDLLGKWVWDRPALAAYRSRICPPAPRRRASLPPGLASVDVSEYRHEREYTLCC